MFCLHCGSQIPEGSKFCFKCGSSLSAVVAVAPTAGGFRSGTPSCSE